MLTQLKWHSSKEKLLAAKQPHDKWVISKDSWEGQGSKAFTWLTAKDLPLFLQEATHSPDAHYYEVIINNTDYPCYVALDIDRDLDEQYDFDIITDIDGYFQEVMSMFITKFTAFITEFYPDAPFKPLVIGETVQACTAHKQTKMSAHVKLSSIPCRNWAHVKAIMTNFHRYIASNIHTTPEEQALFFYYKKGQQACIIDTSIYSNFRSIRLLYSTKWKKDAQPLTPYVNSSRCIYDHLVQVMGPVRSPKDCWPSSLDGGARGGNLPIIDPPPTLEYPLDDREILVPTDYTKSASTHITFKNIPMWSKPSTVTGTETIDGEMLRIVEHHITNHPLFAETFRCTADKPIKITDQYFVTPTVYAFNADHILCPYAATDSELATHYAMLLLECLAPSRTESYEEWLHVGFALHSTLPSKDMLEVWNRFSMKSPKYKRGECKRLWKGMANYHNGPRITSGALHRWAKQDNNAKYEELRRLIKQNATQDNKEHKCRHHGCFEFHHEKNMVFYKCKHPHCTLVQLTNGIAFNVQPAIDFLHQINTLNAHTTLHCKHDIINWGKEYDKDSMMAYPLSPITCIRGQMGVGKTKALVAFMKKHVHKDSKCLVITYQRLLAQKYHEMFKKYGFVSYMEDRDTPMIMDSKVIVCLDSLWRVATSNFQFIFIDEAVSVLLHFNSSLMGNRSAISTKLEFELLKANYVYFLDACVDNGIVHNTVKFIAKRKWGGGGSLPFNPSFLRATSKTAGVMGHAAAPLWIKNTYVRKSNREVEAFICNKKKLEESLRAKAICHVIDLLKEGKKVVVSSSTKSFTDRLEHALKAEFDNAKEIIVHNSETDKSQLNDPASLWVKHDVVIYSPSITAGVSFELDHFDQLVAYVENSFATPSVDLVIQQLFRVRKLTEGKMTLYINSYINLDKSEYPVCEKEADAWLKNRATTLQHYYQNSLSFESNTIIVDNRIQFDRSLLSYAILRNIVVNKNKSLVNFCSLLFNTLKEDYKINVTAVPLLKKEEDALDAVLQLQALDDPDGDVTTDIPFTPDMIITKELHEELKGREFRGEPLTPMEKQCKWIMDASALWGVDPKDVDEEFYEAFIGPYTMANRTKVYENYHKMRRMREAIGNNNHQKSMKGLLDSIMDDRDFNIRLYKDRKVNYYKRLIHGHDLLKQVFPEVDLKKLVIGCIQTIDTWDFNARMSEYIYKMPNLKFKEIQDTFGMTRFEKDKDKVATDCERSTKFCKTILGSAFGIEVDAMNTGSKNSKTDTFNEVKLIKCSMWAKLNAKIDVFTCITSLP